jgi:hypothetical protein
MFSIGTKVASVKPFDRLQSQGFSARTDARNQRGDESAATPVARRGVLPYYRQPAVRKRLCRSMVPAGDDLIAFASRTDTISYQ